MKLKRAESYAGYLKLDKLLNLQGRLSKAHDELQFIVVHQVFELWFKLLAFELEAARDAMLRADVLPASHFLRRVHALVRTMTASFDVLETMRPVDFLAFRERLQPASGFQSLQFREIETISGDRDPRFLELFEGAALRRLRRRHAEPSLWDAYVALLKRHRLEVLPERRLVRSVIRVLREPDRHPLGSLTEALIEYDELFSLWRARHVRMVMRMIGAKPGTGQKSVQRLTGPEYGRMGPAGVDYLRSTLSKLFFPPLWEARTFIE